MAISRGYPNLNSEIINAGRDGPLDPGKAKGVVAAPGDDVGARLETVSNRAWQRHHTESELDKPAGEQAFEQERAYLVMYIYIQ